MFWTTSEHKILNKFRICSELWVVGWGGVKSSFCHLSLFDGLSCGVVLEFWPAWREGVGGGVEIRLESILFVSLFLSVSSISLSLSLSFFFLSLSLDLSSLPTFVHYLFFLCFFHSIVCFSLPCKEWKSICVCIYKSLFIAYIYRDI